MKQIRHKPEQIVSRSSADRQQIVSGSPADRQRIIRKLRDADGMLAAGRTIGEIGQSLAISEQTFRRWRARHGGMKAEEARRLTELEAENKRLKKLLAEAELD